MKLLLLFFLASLSLCAEKIDTFYGPIDVEEPVLLELIESPAFQRLKSIHQYGVGYYTTHREEYTRYDHSIGVFAVLRAKNCSLEEQIAGLLHDVSHTIFSHVGDWIFDKSDQEKDYQNEIHQLFLSQSGLETILEKYHFTAEQVLPGENFPALEQKLPNLCADRIDYNIQGAYHQGFITHEEAQTIFENLQFVAGNWISTEPQLMSKLVRFSLFMTETAWGSSRNHLSSRWLADAILKALDLGSISYDTIHFGTDHIVWDLLMNSEDPFIRSRMEMIIHATAHYSLVDPSEADLIVKSKFRGIDPWIISEGQLVRLTAIDHPLAEEYRNVKEKMERGWAIKYQSPTYATKHAKEGHKREKEREKGPSASLLEYIQINSM